MRRTLLAGLAGLALTLPTAPARAEGVLVLTCNLTYGSSGAGSGSCNLTGEILGAGYVLTPVSMTFGYADGAVCGLRTVAGVILGPFPPISFAWTKVGPLGGMSVSGPVNGGGYTESVPIAGSPCWPTAETTTSVPIVGI